MRLLRSQAGVTFATVIFMVIIVGIMLTMTGQSWRRLMQREREEELLFRGKQIFNAISTWYIPKRQNPPLRELSILHKGVKLANDRYLRGNPEKKDPPSYMLIDPITGKEFKTVQGGDGGIAGVISTSDQEPIKQGNFPPEFKHFEGKKKYSEWVFSPAKQRALMPKTIDTAPTGTLNMPSPFLPDDKDKKKSGP
jgi:type II secretory pathway pseudopilin PulG